MKSSALHTEPEGMERPAPVLRFGLWPFVYHSSIYQSHAMHNGVILITTMYECHSTNTIEPPNKGHFGNRFFVLSSEVVPISEVHHNHSDIIFISTILWINVCIWWSLLVSEIVLYRGAVFLLMDTLHWLYILSIVQPILLSLPFTSSLRSHWSASKIN